MVDEINSNNLIDLIFDLEQRFLQNFGIAKHIITNWDTDVLASVPIINGEILDFRRVYIITDGVNSIKGIYSWN